MNSSYVTSSDVDIAAYVSQDVEIWITLITTILGLLSTIVGGVAYFIHRMRRLSRKRALDLSTDDMALAIGEVVLEEIASLVETPAV